MNRFTCRVLPAIGLLLAVGCNTEPTEDLRNGLDRIVSSPTQLFLSPGESKTVDVGAVDAQGNPLTFAYEVTQVGPGITVRRDSTFLPVYVDDSTLVVPPESERFRFVVTAAAFGTNPDNFPVTSFVVSAGGQSLEIPVQVAPIGSFEATFSTQAPALGETVTITAPPGTKFAPDADVLIEGAADALQPVIVSRAADSTTITFYVAPGTGGPVIVDGVLTASAPGVRLAPATSLPVTGISIDSLDAVFSNPTPAIGETVTMTLPANVKFKRTAAGSVNGLAFPGQVALPAAVTVAADSQSLTFQAPPNAVGAARVDSIIFPGGYSFAVPTRTGITAPSIGTSIDVAFSDLEPGLGELVTATAPGNFRFTRATATTGGPLLVTFGTVVGAVQSVSADSTQFTFIPLPGANANATINGLRLTTAPQFRITLPTVDSLRTEPLTALPNADDPATAPSLTVPAPGGTTTLFDAGPYNGPGDCCFGGHTRLYRVVVTETTTLTGTVDWYEGQDLGLYWVAADGVTPIGDFSGDSGGAGAHPESETITLEPGTYFAAIAQFSAADPGLIKITLERAP
jgi:hypothetical protein